MLVSERLQHSSYHFSCRRDLSLCSKSVVCRGHVDRQVYTPAKLWLIKLITPSWPSLYFGRLVLHPTFPGQIPINVDGVGVVQRWNSSARVPLPWVCSTSLTWFEGALFHSRLLKTTPSALLRGVRTPGFAKCSESSAALKAAEKNLGHEVWVEKIILFRL